MERQDTGAAGSPKVGGLSHPGRRERESGRVVLQQTERSMALRSSSERERGRKEERRKRGGRGSFGGLDFSASLSEGGLGREGGG